MVQLHPYRGRMFLDSRRLRRTKKLYRTMTLAVQLIAMLSLERTFLLLDEPFSGLDERACAFFAAWIKEKAAKQAFLIVTHRLAPLAGISHQHVALADHRLHILQE